VWVVRLEGWFVSDQDAVLIQEAMSSPPADTRCVVLNWSGILQINSTGLGAAMRGSLDVAKLGREYRNCAFSERSARIVAMFRHSFPWNYYDTEEEAVRSCSADAGQTGPTN
jgi:hypothetical protein